jgi:hypothetical protein
MVLIPAITRARWIDYRKRRSLALYVLFTSETDHDHVAFSFTALEQFNYVNEPSVARPLDISLPNHQPKLLQYLRPLISVLLHMQQSHQVLALQ